MYTPGVRKRKPMAVSGGTGKVKRQQTLSFGGRRAADVGPENWRKNKNPLVVAKMERLSKSSVSVIDWKIDKSLAKGELFFNSTGELRINTKTGPVSGHPACVECFLLPFTVMVRSTAKYGHNCAAKRNFTLAGWSDTEKLACFLVGDARNGMKEAYQFSLSSGDKVWWQCGACQHEFISKVACATKKKQPTWCPYCAGQQLCGYLECLMCFAKSLAAWTDTQKLACFLAGDERNGGKQAHEVFLSSGDKVWWQCGACPHEFCSQVADVTRKKRTTWCPYCSGHAVCGEEECKLCKPCCASCKENSGILCRGMYKTTRGNMCRSCYMCSGIATNARAKVSLEQLMLGELLCQAHDDSYLWHRPTSWDCAVLPNLSFKPDCLWAFDPAGDLHWIAGAGKLNLGEVARMVIVEILECGIEQHSQARTVPDKQREKEIREVLEEAGVFVQFLYVTVAHDKHPGAHADDRFFKKDVKTGEYMVVSSRKKAWQARITDMLKKLNGFMQKSPQAGVPGETVYIGR